MNFNITISAESEGGVKKESTLSLKFFCKDERVGNLMKLSGLSFLMLVRI